MILETPKQSFNSFENIESANYRDKAILSNYKEFESCFLAFHPFLRIKKGHYNLIKFIPGKWPNKKSIIEHCDLLTWTEFLQLSNVSNYKKLNACLLYREAGTRYCDKNEYNKLENVFKNFSIYSSGADELPEIIENDVLNFLFKKGYTNLNISSDIEDERIIETTKLINSEIKLPHHPRISSIDSKYLIVVDFDCYFTYYFGTKNNIDELVREINLEGFYCNNETTESWWYEDVIDENKLDYWNKNS